MQEAIEVFLFYLYNDRLDARLDAESAMAVLHIAHYYGAPRLVGLCERLLAQEIKSRDPQDEGLNTSDPANLYIDSAVPQAWDIALNFRAYMKPQSEDNSNRLALFK